MSRTINMQSLTLAAITASEKHTLMLLNVKSRESRWSVKYRSRAGGHSVCWRVCQGQLLCKVRHSQLSPLQRNILDAKSLQSQWSPKSRSRALGHSVCLKSMLWIITMQGLTLAAITTTEKHLMPDLPSNHDKATGAQNLDQEHWVIVQAWHVCWGQLLCKVWHSSYHYYREMHFTARLNVKSWQNHLSMKSMSRVAGHSACLKRMSRSITVQWADTPSYYCNREMHWCWTWCKLFTVEGIKNLNSLCSILLQAGVTTRT